MSLTRSALIGLMTVMVIAMATSGVRAQSSDPPSNAPLQAGPLVLAPVIRLTNVGHDSNVFNRNQNDNPQSDVTATLSPSLDAVAENGARSRKWTDPVRRLLFQAIDGSQGDRYGYLRAY